MDISSERLRVSTEDYTAKIETEMEYLDHVKDGSRPKKGAKPYRVSVCWFSLFALPWIKFHPHEKRLNIAWARRFVACHHACIGISTEDLEKGRIEIVRRHPVESKDNIEEPAVEAISGEKPR